MQHGSCSISFFFFIPSHVKSQFVREQEGRRMVATFGEFFCTKHKNNAFEQHLTNEITFSLNAFKTSQDQTEKICHFLPSILMFMIFVPTIL